MSETMKKWLITAGCALGAIVLTALIGVLIVKMTGGEGSVKPSESEAVVDSTDENEGESKTPEATTEETPSETEATTEESTTEEPSSETEPPETEPPVVVADIHQLSAEEIADIRANYKDTEQYFYAGGSDRDEQNRAQSCVTRNDWLNNAIGNVIVFGPDTNPPSVYFSFILTTEYAPNTEDILNVLAALGIRGLFLTDKPYAEHNPAIIQRILNEGHEIGSMGATLPEGGIAKLGLEELTANLYDFHCYMRDTYGYVMGKFYFSYDLYSEQAVATAVRMGYHVIFYSANYEDYDHNKAIDLTNFMNSLAYQLHY